MEPLDGLCYRASHDRLNPTHTDRERFRDAYERWIVKRFVSQVINQGRVATIAEIIHPRYRYHGPGGVEAEGRAGAQSIIDEFRAAFSDLHVEITAEIAQGDLVALTMIATGTHDGDLMGLAPTGATIELPMAIVSRFEDGQIVEEREYYDSATMMSQLGLDTA